MTAAEFWKWTEAALDKASSIAIGLGYNISLKQDNSVDHDDDYDDDRDDDWKTQWQTRDHVEGTDEV